MLSARDQIIELIEAGSIPEHKINDALVVAKITPDGERWRTFIDSLFLWLGGLALAFSIMFFVAYNWSDIGRFAKFGLVEVLIICAVTTYCILKRSTVASKVSLLVASICIGVLLALYGQTYQTGADPWQLFFYWALMMLPWAIISRFPATWIIWISLMNISFILYYQTFRGAFWFLPSSDTSILWVVFSFNTFVLAAWEFMTGVCPWLSERWAVRLLAIASGVPINWLVLDTIFRDGNQALFVLPIYGIWLATVYIVYRKIRPDLFMLAGCCLSVITVSISFLGEQLLQDGSPAGFLFLAIVIIGMGAGSAFWLKKINQEIMS
ncbi:MAG: putative membrane protein [Desulforhopalus sp.]|jgi:uncharacterized membrane protein